jgi:hypothetical protein
MEAIDLVCFKCKNWNMFIGGCKAFPDGIPDEITSGENEHEKLIPEQDNNIVFEPIES